MTNSSDRVPRLFDEAREALVAQGKPVTTEAIVEWLKAYRDVFKAGTDFASVIEAIAYAETRGTELATPLQAEKTRRIGEARETTIKNLSSPSLLDMYDGIRNALAEDDATAPGTKSLVRSTSTPPSPPSTPLSSGWLSIVRISMPSTGSFVILIARSRYSRSI